VNSSVNMIGVMVTSNSWNGTCLIFSIARHARVITVDNPDAGCSGARIASSSCIRAREGRPSALTAGAPARRRGCRRR